jgi:PAS domain S-box-containing protein
MDRFGLDKDPRVFAQCVHSCREPVMFLDLRGRLVYVNPAWVKTYGHSEKSVLGHSPRIIRHKYLDRDIYRKIWEHIQNPKIGFWKGELVSLSADGREVPVLLTITPVKREDETNSGYIGIALDLTEEKKLRAQVEQQDRMATIGILTSGMAHEIGTPIGVIRGRAEMLLMDCPQDERLKKNLEIIVKQTDRISGFINSLLKLSRSSGDQKLESVDAPRVIKGVLELLTPKFRKARIQLEMNSEENLIALADVARLEQITINIVVNAIHAIEKKRETELPTESAQFVRVMAFRTANSINVSIEDSGCGISKENLKKIFEPFFTTKSAGQGTGLGLSIVNRLLDEMGGAISVESTEGKGTKFTFALKPSKGPEMAGSIDGWATTEPQ